MSASLSWTHAFVVLALLSQTPAYAQGDDAPIPYPDTPESASPRAEGSRESWDGPSAATERDDALSGSDDPNLGLAVEALVGAMFLDSSRGRFAEPRLGLGARLTWEYGRLLNIESLREALWVDAQWTYSWLSEGTQLIRTTDHLNNFTLAPAYCFTFGEQKQWGVYGQLGGGVSYERSTLDISGQETLTSGLRPVIQYGVGLRGRPVLLENPHLAVSFRLEVTRFRRGYLNDTFAGGSIGLAF